MTIFAQNLSLLISENENVSRTEICKNIGVTRRQLKLYLSGEVEPRSNIIFKILTYFNVDERVLFEPLETLRRREEKQGNKLYGLLRLPDSVTTIDEAVLPSGFYLRWFLSFDTPDALARDLILVYRKDQTTRFTGTCSVPARAFTDVSATNRRFDGRIQSYGDTLVAIKEGRSGGGFNFEVIHHAQDKAQRGQALTGICVRQPQEVFRGGRNKTWTVWERIDPAKQSILQLRRNLVHVPIQDAPEKIQAYLDEHVNFPEPRMVAV